MGHDRESRPSLEGELDLDLLWDEDPDLDAHEGKSSAPNPCQKATLSMALEGETGAKKSRDSQQLRAAVQPHRTRSSQALAAVRQPTRAWSEPAPGRSTREAQLASDAAKPITSDDPFAVPTQPPPPSLNPALGSGPDPMPAADELGEMSAPPALDFSDPISPPPADAEAEGFDETSFGDITAELAADDVSPEPPFGSDWAQNDIPTRPPPSHVIAEDNSNSGPASGSASRRNTSSEGDVVRQAAGRTGLSLDDFAFDAMEELDEMEAGALGLVSRRARISKRPSTTSLPAVEPVATPSAAPKRSAARDMQDRYEVGDYSGALEIAARILEAEPGDRAARLMSDECTATLTQMLAARLGSLAQRPTVGVPLDQIRWLSLDHRAGFLLSLMDGQLSIDDVLDVSGMPRLDAMRLLADLVDQRVIALAPA